MRYFKQSIWDFALCFLISTSLSVNVFAGYEMHDPWSGSLFVTAFTAFFAMAVLFAARFNRYGKRISVAVTAAVLFAEAAALYYTGAFSGAEPIDENPILFWIIVITVSVTVFWTTRPRAGILLIFLAGTSMTAAFDFLRYPVTMEGYFTMMLGMAVLYLERVHSLCASMPHDGKIRFAPYFAQSVAISLIAFLMAAWLYYGVVKPLDPPAEEAELAQKLMSTKIMKDAGISSKKVIVAEKPEKPLLASPNPAEQYKKEQSSGGWLGDSGSFIDVLAVTYKKHAAEFWIAASAPALLLILAVLFKLLLRKKWYANLLKKTNEDGAAALYLYFVKKLKKAGFKRPEDLTLLEYAAASQERLDKFSVYDADFLRLTQIYLKLIYGYQRISDEERELFHEFYQEFNKNLRAEMGSLRYCLQFFT